MRRVGYRSYLTRVSGTTVLLYTQLLNLQTLHAFRIFSIFFSFVYVFIFALSTDCKFRTILNLKNLFANLQTFWGEFFHCVFNLVKVIKSEERAVFSMAFFKDFPVGGGIF